ncbi:hypothetical protein QCA50_007538 [Cerrena zonata]|uniref:Uncharacterized protein n=1 Tax=Cerrena zonata TaxID=2478898 RepID=A0AAW0GBZ7_9APHY
MNRDLTHSLRTVYHSFLDPTSVAHSCQALYVVPLSFHSALIDRTTRSSCLEPIVRSGTIHHCRWIMEYVFSLPIIPTLLTPVSNRKSGTYVLRESNLILNLVPDLVDLQVWRPILQYIHHS